jgi:hypothetical protein
MPGLKGEQNLDGFFINLFLGNLNIGTSSRICHLNTEVVTSDCCVTAFLRQFGSIWTLRRVMLTTGMGFGR